MRFSFDKASASPAEEEKASRPPSSFSPNRRAFLAALGAALFAPGEAFAKKTGEKPKSRTPESDALKEFPENFPYEPREYEMGELAGMTFPKDKLLSLYTGIEGKVPPLAKIDFAYQGWKMWRLKAGRMPHDVALARRGREMIEEYKKGSAKEKNLTTLSQYIADMSRMVETTKKVIDWETLKKLPELRYLSPEEIDVVRRLSEKIMGKDMVAYSMTELLPSDNGPQNKKIFDFLLQMAGSMYLRLIPAQDTSRSFGYYQLTERYAVSETAKEKSKWGSASIINQAVDPRFRIPAQMLSMKDGVHHHRGAYLFAVKSISDLVAEVRRQKSEMPAKDILAALESDHTLLLQYISTAHHQSGYAPKVFASFLLDEYFRDKEEESRLSYEEYLIKRGGELAREGRASLAELKRYRGGGRGTAAEREVAVKTIRMGKRIPALSLYVRKTKSNRRALD